jgi:threonylcarbamoyladenosine tRNA methylthiotransferase MtaB
VSTFHIENFGCRATQADGAALERQFEERGLSRVASPALAEVVVLNTCTVTAEADRDARAAIRRVQRQNPKAKIIVTGCYAQRAPEEIAALPGVSFVIGNSHKHQLADLTLQNTASKPSPSFIPLHVLSSTAENKELRRKNSIYVSDIFAHTELLAAPVFDAVGERTRPNLKVQDGCDNRCSFCVIPYVRGQSRSLPLAQILRDVNGLVESGYREVVISGINLGRWGRDLQDGRFGLGQSGFGEKAPFLNSEIDIRFPRPESRDPKLDFEYLIRAILAETNLEKLRISSVEPMDWSDELIALVAQSSRIAKHAHVPLQSGSDAVLRRMHRKYRPWHYREKIEKIRAAMPTAAIGADVMVGFPGESNAEFEATRRLIEDLPFTYLHVFTYSVRPGTPAAEMRDQVPVHTARERNRILRDLAAEKKQAFMRGFIGGTVEAITLAGSYSAGESESSESKRGNADPGFTEALTDNFLKLRLNGHHLPNQWLRVQIKDVQVGGGHDGALLGTPLRTELGASLDTPLRVL